MGKQVVYVEKEGVCVEKCLVSFIDHFFPVAKGWNCFTWRFQLLASSKKTLAAIEANPYIME